MPRVYLTTGERDAARAKQRKEALLQELADGLATYRNRNGLTKAELGRSWGCARPQ